MKKVLLVAFLAIAPISSANAWYDSYGGFTCGYMDPLTSFFDSIFGPPCPPPVAVAVPAAPMVAPAPVAVLPPQPAFFPGFIQGPAPWQPLLPMW
jgi:hypothetical protein